MNFSSIAILIIKWFLSVLDFLVVIELTSPSSLFDRGFCFLVVLPLCPFALTAFPLDSSLDELEDEELSTSSSSLPPGVPVAADSPIEAVGASSPFRALAFFYSFSLAFFSLRFLRSII